MKKFFTFNLSMQLNQPGLFQSVNFFIKTVSKCLFPTHHINEINDSNALCYFRKFVNNIFSLVIKISAACSFFIKIKNNFTTSYQNVSVDSQYSYVLSFMSPQRVYSYICILQCLDLVIMYTTQNNAYRLIRKLLAKCLPQVLYTYCITDLMTTASLSCDFQ